MIAYSSDATQICADQLTEGDQDFVPRSMKYEVLVMSAPVFEDAEDIDERPCGGNLR